MTVPPMVAARDRWYPWLAALPALLLYLALGQNLVHGFDALYYMQSVEGGAVQHPRMVLFLPLALGWTRLLAPIGVDTYEALRALSAVAAAAGVWLAYRAARRLELSPSAALRCAAGCAAVPAVIYSASVLEADTLVFAGAAAAWLPFARLLGNGRPSAAAATGAVTAVTAGIHAAGHLLALLLCGLLLAWDWPRRPLRHSALLAAALLATHLLLATALVWSAGATQQADMATNTVGHVFDPAFVPHVLWHEWLLPYLPWCLLSLLVVRRRRDRGTAVGYLVCLLGYLYVTALILGYQRFAADLMAQGNIVERGTFLFGITLPMVLLATRATGPRVGWAAVALSLVSGVVQVRAWDWPPDPPGYSDGCAAALHDRPAIVWVADTREWAWIARRHPGIHCRLIEELPREARWHREHHGAVVVPELYALKLDMEYDMAVAGGRAFVLTDKAMLHIEHHDDRAFAAVLPLLRERYEFVPLDAGSFHAVRLQRR